MVHLIIGENATGKTLYLTRVLKKIGLRDVCTNLVDDVSLVNTPYNKDRIAVLNEILETATIDEVDSILMISGANAKITPAFSKIATIICKDRDNLILDEPCFGLTMAEKSRLVDLLCRVARTFKRVYIVTHYEVMLSIPNDGIFTVEMDKDTSKLNITQVPEEIADEIID